MRNFQESFETRKQAFISAFSTCMTVPVVCFRQNQDTFSRMHFLHFNHLKKYTPKPHIFFYTPQKAPITPFHINNNFQVTMRLKTTPQTLKNKYYHKRVLRNKYFYLFNHLIKSISAKQNI